MNATLKNALAVVAGIIIGSTVNMALVYLGPSIIPLPEGVNMENFAENINLFETKHFIFPFLAHALGTLVGAFVAAKIAVNNKMNYALVIGGFFLLGGIINVMMLGGPTWFKVADLVLAYIPMAWIGGRLGGA